MNETLSVLSAVGGFRFDLAGTLVVLKAIVVRISILVDFLVLWDFLGMVVELERFIGMSLWICACGYVRLWIWKGCYISTGSFDFLYALDCDIFLSVALVDDLSSLGLARRIDSLLSSYVIWFIDCETYLKGFEVENKRFDDDWVDWFKHSSSSLLDKNLFDIKTEDSVGLYF